MVPIYLVGEKDEVHVLWGEDVLVNYKCKTCGREAAVVGDLKNLNGFCVDNDYHEKNLHYKHCGCSDCLIDGPMYKSIRSRLPPTEKIFFNKMIENLHCAQEDSNYFQCQLDGAWPGWEWIIEERKKRDL